ncbi:MAG: hypothetical protein UR28_C0001G0019 [Candidatus Peregrinibacteria bacterium GW2011_GWF2_33_10]|nr:MAG: hypothetical protein UR28_C0001G0019 [Candidatus Peregrinibacteria bacterium GW2011_GWF2_33_10]OGJ44023.1 MAG: 6-phosphogluconolactonase [Candidatus Peregrinibacteria bacterium RIFOXYA2_FULL_33_21]OGJ47186.1 MAG: 6-phosphogluconolactonase [Candidatus Peregrinibacteria bacterium RIFOXYA12_FULL_33_12]OGJ49920.1 MAG: 6-phosphogluconolactonase [Candidatus Peregrinibacteria bacterium RIFOXYB2_FULL_33_20]
MFLKNFKQEKEFIKSAVAYIQKICSSKKSTIRIGLSGGSTPKPVYEALSRDHNFDFSKIEFYQIDERYIPKNSKDSNYKMIYDSLIKKQSKKIKAFKYFDTSIPINESLKQYQQDLKKIPNLSLDLIILGMGNDGHVASIFPYSKAIATKKTTYHTQTNNFAVKDRLTVTFPVIMKSKKLLLLIKGKDKAQTLNDLLKSQKSLKEWPAKKILKHQNLHIYLCK